MRYLFPFILLLAGCHGSDHSKTAAGKPVPPESRTIPGRKGATTDSAATEKITFIRVDTAEHLLQMFWKDEAGTRLYTLPALKNYLQQKGKEVVFAMNGGMYTEDFSPLGLYIEKGRELHRMKFYNNPSVNFGMQPQGVFYTTRDGKGGVCRAEDFAAVKERSQVQYATQSAPLLLLNSGINPRLTKSNSTNIRNGAGLLPSGEVVLAISNEPVTFREFAHFFQTAGCTAALYLDGAISGVYYPQKGIDPAPIPYGVMIGMVKK